MDITIFIDGKLTDICIENLEDAINIDDDLDFEDNDGTDIINYDADYDDNIDIDDYSDDFDDDDEDYYDDVEDDADLFPNIDEDSDPEDNDRTSFLEHCLDY